MKKFFLLLVLSAPFLSGCPKADFSWSNQGQLTETLTVEIDFSESKYVKIGSVFPGISAIDQINGIGFEFLDREGQVAQWGFIERYSQTGPIFPYRGKVLINWWGVDCQSNTHRLRLFACKKGEPLEKKYPANMAYFQAGLNGALLGNEGLPADGIAWEMELPIDRGLPLYAQVPAQGAIDFELEGNCLYVACAYAGLKVFDVSDPANPIFLAEYSDGVDIYDNNGYVVDLVVKNGFIYYLGPQHFRVIDATDLTQINMVWEKSKLQPTLDGQISWLDPNTVFVGGFGYFSLTNPSVPQQVGFDFKVKPKKFCQAGNFSLACGQGFSVINLTPSVYELPSSLLTWQDISWSGQLATCWDVAGTVNQALVCAGQNGIYQIDIFNPTKPVTLSQWQNPEMNYGAFSLFIDGQIAYTGWGENGLVVLDLSTSPPTKIGHRYDRQNVWGIKKIGQYIYLADSLGLKIIDTASID